MRNRRANFLAHPPRGLQSPFLMACLRRGFGRQATGTETTAPAGIRHEKLVGTFRTPHAGKALLKVAAFQELFYRRGDSRTPKAVALLVTLFIDRFKPRIKPLDLPAPTYPPL